MSSGLAEMWDTLSSLQTLESTPIPAQMFQLSKALSNIQMCSPLLHPKLYFHTKVLQLSPVFVLLSWPEFIRKFTTLFPHLLLTLLPHLNYQEALTSPRPLTIYMLLSMHFFSYYLIWFLSPFYTVNHDLIFRTCSSFGNLTATSPGFFPALWLSIQSILGAPETSPLP